MHKNILNNDQIEILPLIKEFKRTFYLVGGTAIALQIGHRRSINFDLFRSCEINSNKIIDKIKKYKFHFNVIRNVSGHLDMIVNNVKITFFNYPFEIDKSIKFENIIQMPQLLDFSAMKVYVLGRRAKWKDYVDLCILLEKFFTVKDITLRANEIYGNLFSEKLFRAQLAYFEGIDYSEKIEYIGIIYEDSEIKKKLIDIVTNF